MRLTRVCLERLERWSEPPCELILVDNGSTDGTREWLESFSRASRSFTAVKLLRNRTNAGYSVAMNQGLAAASGELIVFGNNDAAVTPSWLSGMREAFSAREDVGGVSPCSNPPDSVAPGSPWDVPGLYDDLPALDRLVSAARLAPQPPAFIEARGFVPGFWFLTSAEVLARVGGFDERFTPGGYEDWDLQWRMRRAGRALGFAERSFVHHAWSATSRANGVEPPAADAARRRLLLDKHPGISNEALEYRSFAPGRPC